MLRNTSFCVLLVFFANTIGPLPLAQADEFRLPTPGVRVALSPEYNPAILKGIEVHPDNPFRFDFILDQGDETPTRGHAPESVSSSRLPSNEGLGMKATQRQNPDALKQESTKLIKYFLASLTIPEKDLWVNLSPYEKDRIVPESFGQTEMGRDLLAEDYILKQITASLIYPEGETGKKFWKRIYEEAAQKFGTTNIPVNTFNKVWIVPEKAVVYENAKSGTAYVVESKLKVMLEQDYLSMEKHQRQPESQPGDMFKSELQRTCPQADCEHLRVSGMRTQAIKPLNVKTPQGENFTQNNNTNALGSQIVREIVIPELTKEVNEDKNFSQLRQVYNSLILATWYKNKIKDSILAQVYDDKNKVYGILSSPNALIGDPEHIYQRYLQAFKKGAYNYIKEEIDPATQQTIPRKYFSGGLDFAMVVNTTGMRGMKNMLETTHDPAAISNLQGRTMAIEADMLSKDAAMIDMEAPLLTIRGNIYRLMIGEAVYPAEDYNELIEAFDELEKFLDEEQRKNLSTLRTRISLHWYSLSNPQLEFGLGKEGKEILDLLRKLEMSIHVPELEARDRNQTIRNIIQIQQEMEGFLPSVDEMEDHISTKFNSRESVQVPIETVPLNFHVWSSLGALTIEEARDKVNREKSYIFETSIGSGLSERLFFILIKNPLAADQAMIGFSEAVEPFLKGTQIQLLDKGRGTEVMVPVPSGSLNVDEIKRRFGRLPDSVLLRPTKSNGTISLGVRTTSSDVVEIKEILSRNKEDMQRREVGEITQILNTYGIAGLPGYLNKNNLRLIGNGGGHERFFVPADGKPWQVVNFIYVNGQFKIGYPTNAQGEIDYSLTRQLTIVSIHGKEIPLNNGNMPNEAPKLVNVNISLRNDQIPDAAMNEANNAQNSVFINSNVPQRYFLLGRYQLRPASIKLGQSPEGFIYAKEEMEKDHKGFNMWLLYSPEPIHGALLEDRLNVVHERSIHLFKARENAWTIDVFHPYTYQTDEINYRAGSGGAEAVLSYLVDITRLSGTQLQSSQEPTFQAARFYIKQGLNGVAWPKQILIDGSLVYKGWQNLRSPDLMNKFFDSENVGDIIIKLNGGNGLLTVNLGSLEGSQYKIISALNAEGKKEDGFIGRTVSIRLFDFNVELDGKLIGYVTDINRTINFRGDHAMTTQDLGGIDLTSDKALSIQNNGQGIKFHIDPAQLEQFRNTPGFTPVIINIQPVDVRKFLGLDVSANDSVIP